MLVHGQRGGYRSGVTAAISPFPWHQLPRVSGSCTRLESCARRALQAFDPSRLVPALNELIGTGVEGYGEAPLVEHDSQNLSVCTLESASAAIAVHLEQAAVALLLSRLLDRPVSVDRLDAPLSEPLRGAWHALGVELGRRLARAEPPQLLSHGTPNANPKQAWCFGFWVRIDGRSYAGRLVVVPKTPEAPPPLTGDVPVQLPLVMGHGVMNLMELTCLRVGDAWLPGAGWTVNAALRGSALAVSPSQELGFQVELADRIFYHGLGQLPFEPPNHSPNTSNAPNTNPAEQNPMEQRTLESPIFDATVVVRVEIGSLTLSAREWMALAPGDVVSTQQPPGSPVVLRAAGAEVARGELVTVDGELGVRITQLLAAPDTAAHQPQTPTAD